MVKFMKNKPKPVIEPDSYILPSDNKKMRLFVQKFKVDMMENVISKIKFAVENRLPIIEAFQFKNSPFVVTINEQEFEPNLSHISKYYKDKEMYELCPRIEKLREILKNKSNEKKKPDDIDGHNPSL